MSLPKKCIVDTNVPKAADWVFSPGEIDAEKRDCISACIASIAHITKGGAIVLDEGGEILIEYHRQLVGKGQPGQGSKFIKWVHDHLSNAERIEYVSINKKGSTYKEFPNHKGLKKFDISDRKFVAASNAHPDKPPILQATDSKWWGWKDALDDCGITVEFLCKKYIKKKYNKKMGS